MGAATALYSATCHALRQYGNGNFYQVNIQSVVSLSGWLPCSGYISSYYHIIKICFDYFFLKEIDRFRNFVLLTYLVAFIFFRIMKKRMEESVEASRRAASLPILLCHGSGC